MPDEKTPRDDQRDPNDDETLGRNRHGTMDDEGEDGTKGSNFENTGPVEDALDDEGPNNPNVDRDQSTVTGPR